MVDKPESFLLSLYPIIFLSPCIRLLCEDRSPCFRVENLPSDISKGRQGKQPGDQEHDGEGDHHGVRLAEHCLVKLKVWQLQLRHPGKHEVDEVQEKGLTIVVG